jgi:hypothetical protein
VNRFSNRNGKRKGLIGKHLPAQDENVMQINDADVAELVDARDLKSPGAAEITHLSDLTGAGNPHEAGRETRPYCLTRRRLFRWLEGPRKRGPTSS